MDFEFIYIFNEWNCKNPAGTAAIERTPNNLLGKTRNKLNVGKKYHSGKISNGVANGFAGSPNPDGSNTESLHTNVPKITIGKM
jgi:hypothetical protein